ncbi:uncharacterized protein LOC116255378 isoform X2 [Nymphaea colorata]|uniref:uncharacterized protein LOC116255378 isoform X2 n=1 Tax=Nymphaea colorata TaxID=210225 RepID=UPI00129E3D98|nr:uncharacterized protein LOC116255378 isoform X2 [Nymphaea colorata]
MHCGQNYIHCIDDSRGLVQDSSFFFISAIRKGTIMKLPNVDQCHKPALRLKKLDEMFKSEVDNKKHMLSCPHMGEHKSSRAPASSSLNCSGMKNCYPDQANCLIEDSISTSHHNSPPKMDGFFSNESCIKHRSDDCSSGEEFIDNDDFVFSSLTLKEIQNMCKSRQRSASLPNPSKTSDLSSRSNCKKRSHAHRKPSEDESDLEETLGSWRRKLPARKLKIKKRALVTSQTISSSSASELPVRIKQENDTILSCGNSELAPISTVFESQNVEDMPGGVKVKVEEPESSLCSSAITDCHKAKNQNGFDYKRIKGRIQNAVSCSATERILQDSGAFDRTCPHPGNSSCHDRGFLCTLPVIDKVDHLESFGHVYPICVTNRMPLEVPSNEICSGSTGTTSMNGCSPEGSQSSSFIQKETSSLVVNDVVVPTIAADADDDIKCLGEFVSVDNTLNSVDISNGISFTESVLDLDTQGFNSKLRITSLESKANEDSETVDIKDRLEQGSGHTNVEHDGGHVNVPKSEGEPPVRVNADVFNPEKDKFNDTSNKFFISKALDVQSTTGNGKFGNPPHGQLDEGQDCSFKFVPADGSFNNDEGNFAEARPVLDANSVHPKLRIISLREKAGEQFDTAHTEGCLQQNNEHAIPHTPYESPTKLLVDKIKAEEDRLNISSEVPTPEGIQTQSASGTSNFDTSSHCLPGCSEGCQLESVETRSREVACNSSVILETSTGYYPHDRKSFATKVLSDMRAKQTPKKLFVKRKEKLCQAMDDEEMYKKLKTPKRRQGIHFDKWTKSGIASQAVGFEEADDAAEPVSRDDTSIPPTGCSTYSTNHDGHPVLAQKSSPPLATKGILKPSCGPCIVSCSCPECASIRSYAQKSIDFSQQQMHDIKCLATVLVRELKSLTSVIEENLLSETCLSTLRYSIDEVKAATTNAAEVEETTRRWLSMMSRDCSRFCKIMKVKEKKPVKVGGLQKEQKKITFADEAGGLLCHVKVFGDHSDSSSAHEEDGGWE